MALTAEDKSRLSKSDQQKLTDLTNKWNNATTKEEKESLQAQAKAIRENSGYTSNENGTYKAELPSINRGSRGGSLSDGGTSVEIKQAVEQPQTIQEQPKQGSVATDYKGYTYSGSDTKQGAKGQSVSDIQTALKYLGYDLGSYGENQDGIDGSFGGKTLEAVNAFQKENGLNVNGVVDKNTAEKLSEAVSKKISGSTENEPAEQTQNQNQENESQQTEIVPQAITVYRLSGTDEEGNIVYEPIQGTISYDKNGGGHTSIDGGSLENGDAVQSSDGTWWFYDPEVGHGISQEEWEEKYDSMLDEMVKPATSALDLNSAVEELYNALFNEGANQFLDAEGNLDLDDFLTWYEAQALAQEKYNPLYDQALNESLENIDKKARNSGFYGQLPTEALKNQAVAETEAQRTSDILDFANSLVGESKDSAIDKLNAQISAKEADLENILTLLQLVEAYESGSNAGTTGMKNNGKISFVNPDGTPSKYSSGEDTDTQKDTDTQGNTDTQEEQVKKYDNGSLSFDQVKELQEALGFTGDGIDGRYGPNTKSKAEGLTADEAYKKYVTDKKNQYSKNLYSVDYNQEEGTFSIQPTNGTNGDYYDSYGLSIGEALEYIDSMKLSENEKDSLKDRVYDELGQIEFQQNEDGTLTDSAIHSLKAIAVDLVNHGYEIPDVIKEVIGSQNISNSRGF